MLKRLPNNSALLKCIKQLKSQNYQTSSPSTHFSQNNSNSLFEAEQMFHSLPIDYFTTQSYSKQNQPSELLYRIESQLLY